MHESARQQNLSVSNMSLHFRILIAIVTNFKILSGNVNEFQPSSNLVKILKSNLAVCGETPSFGNALTPISCRHT